MNATGPPIRGGGLSRTKENQVQPLHFRRPCHSLRPAWAYWACVEVANDQSRLRDPTNDFQNR